MLSIPSLIRSDDAGITAALRDARVPLTKVFAATYFLSS
jgi:hypothetical protein